MATQVYVMPLAIVLTDRVDGKLRYITFDANNNVSLTLDTSNIWGVGPPILGKYTFNAYEEPTFSGYPQVRVFSSNGTLGIELVDATIPIDDFPIYAIKPGSYQSILVSVTPNAGQPTGFQLTYTINASP